MMNKDTTKKNVLLLAFCQALNNTSNSILVTVSALAGYALASDKYMATFPLALQFTATTISSLPASLLMKRFGRRVGFLWGAVIGIFGGGISALGIFYSSFSMFAIGAIFIGVMNSFALYYRFAAADTASEDFRSKAISLVMAGGVIAAIVGPEMAKWSKGLFPSSLFAGAYLLIALLPVISIAILLFIEIVPPSVEELKEKSRKVGDILRQPCFIAAVLGGMISYGSMVLLMTSTPLAMKACSFDFNDTAFVIQWHILGMFLPSFFTGHLIRQFGVLQIMLTGIFLFIASIWVNLSGTGLSYFWTGLFLLGLGWNFLFIGSTTLLTYAYRPVEKSQTQAINEFLVFGTVAVASLSSGAIHYQFGWGSVNYGVIPLLMISLTAILWLHFRHGNNLCAQNS